MFCFGGITAAFLASCIVNTSAQTYLSRGWKLQDLSQYPDIVQRVNRVADVATGSSGFSGLTVLALYTQSAFTGQKYFVIYQDGTSAPCRLSWTEGRWRTPSDISGPSCGFNISDCDDDDDGDDDYDVGVVYSGGRRPSALSRRF